MVDIENRKVRHNGFDLPLHPSQIFTYFLFLSDILTFFFIDLVSLSDNIVLAVCLGVAYLILAAGTVYYGFISTRINP